MHRIESQRLSTARYSEFDLDGGCSEIKRKCAGARIAQALYRTPARNKGVLAYRRRTAHFDEDKRGYCEAAEIIREPLGPGAVG